ncbi:MAG TPA: GGDEF domain-containing protein [Sphingomicrobium sp.]|nr:GGDEF domain-containing protein [Sphingomicrobium sp.]
MPDIAPERLKPAELLEEIMQLRGQIARLEAEVRELDRLAHLDPLVPLYNRRGMMRELDLIISRHSQNGTPAAMLFVDLDGLKALNDGFGHAGGDAALIHVAEQLLAGVRSTDCVARLGGDEFCILLDNADEASAIETARRLVNAISANEIMFEGVPMPLSVAIGLTLVEPGDSATTILARADQAMYRVKVAA